MAGAGRVVAAGSQPAVSPGFQPGVPVSLRAWIFVRLRNVRQGCRQLRQADA